jgi:hypothetical protein
MERFARSFGKRLLTSSSHGKLLTSFWNAAKEEDGWVEVDAEIGGIYT